MPGSRSFEASFTSVLDFIYETAANDGVWEPALERICEFIGAKSADLNFVDPAVVEFTRIEATLVDTGAWQRYMTDFTSDVTNVNPRMPHFLRRGEGDIWADNELWTPAERNRIPFFTELVQPGFGLYDALNTWIRKTHDGRPWIALLVHFGLHQGQPSIEARRRLQILLPHLRRACASAERLLRAESENALLSETLDHVDEAVALIDHSGRILRANKLATMIFHRGKGLTLARTGHLIITHSAARDAYARAVAQCLSPILLLSSASAAPPARIAIPRVDAAPLVITLQPLGKSQTQTVNAVAALFIADPDAKPMDRTQALRCAYGLSPAEARLIQALSEGFSLREFAASSHLSYETVRSYLRQSLAKTGARRQSDLVRLTQRLR